MNKVKAIFLKEFKGFIFNPNFYIVCFLCSVIFSWMYPITLKQFSEQLANSYFQQGMPQQYLNIHYAVFQRHLSVLNLILIFIVPALTMRLFAEEKKMRTFDLLLTSPITSVQIVTGKYLSALAAILVLVFTAFLYPLATVAFAKISWLPLIIAFLGIYLLAATYAAMNLFCSSLTQSAIVAYVMAVIFNVAIWFLGAGVETFDNSTVRAVFEHISLNQHLVSMVEGTIRTNSLIYFASVIFLFTFLCERVVEASRWR